VLGGFDDPRDGTVPGPDARAPERYRRLHQAILTGRIRACHDLSEGGLAVALAEMAIGGRLGVDVHSLPDDDEVVALFSESTGRFAVELAPGDHEWLADALGEPVLVLGTVTATPMVRIGACSVTLDAAMAAFGAEGATWQPADTTGGAR
jgi:phosphoribosylformylglycinamidine synthase